MLLDESCHLAAALVRAGSQDSEIGWSWTCAQLEARERGNRVRQCEHHGRVRRAGERHAGLLCRIAQQWL